MAFPVSGAVQISGLPLTTDQLQTLRQPDKLQKLRQAFLNQLFKQQAVSQDLGGGVPQQLAQIAQILGRSAGNEPTVYDNGSFRSSASGNANLLSQQVERALTQVLGRSPGRGPDGFINALNSAFPTATDGKVITTPTRSVVSLTSNGNYSTSAANGNGLGQLSVEQANLYRQASLIAADALRVLEGLQPFEPTADVDAVEALRALVRSQINTLVEEFGRLDEPRKERVETYLNTLYTADGSSGYLRQMGEQARLIDRNGTNGSVAEVFPVTLTDETQVAGYALLTNYVNTLRTVWKQYADTTEVETKVTGRYSERLSRASIMLPVIADSNTSFMAAMDSIGFTASERRSDAALFSTLSPQQSSSDSTRSNLNALINSITLSLFPILDIIVIVPLPDMTVNDFNEWVDRFTTIEAPSILSTSGQFGLDFVTDQADTLFWVISFVLSAIKQASDFRKGLLLEKVLSFERVQQTLSELVFQLDTLANLGVGSTSPAIVGEIVTTSGSVIPS